MINTAIFTSCQSFHHEGSIRSFFFLQIFYSLYTQFVEIYLKLILQSKENQRTFVEIKIGNKITIHAIFVSWFEHANHFDLLKWLIG